MSNSRVNVKIDNLAPAIRGFIEDYSYEVQKLANQAVKDVAKNGAERLKTEAKNAGIGGRKYVKSFKAEMTKSTIFGEAWTIKSTQYRVAHLLEHGHIVKSHGKYTGKRTEARHHWTTVEQECTDALTDKILSIIDKVT